MERRDDNRGDGIQGARGVGTREQVGGLVEG